MATEEFVQSLARGLAVIKAFDAGHRRLTLSEVARRTELSRAAARRFLLTLEQLGYLHHEDGTFVLTPRVLELGHSYLSALTLPEVAQPHLERLSAQVGESASLAVLDGTDVVYVARVATRRLMSVQITIGTRLPAFATSMGRVLLAGLDQRRRHDALPATGLPALTPATITDPTALAAELGRVTELGWALVDGELEVGLRSIAVAVHDQGGSPVAAVNVSMSALGDAQAAVERVVPALRATATAIESDLALV